ncbi:MAG: hypothetical protein NTU44_08955, partial [Bacteroidetes bacterium]|nr:hypothetical protein [Bacteroidota bacterium]
ENMPDGMQGLTGLTQDQYNAINVYASQAVRLVSQFSGSTPMGLPIGFDNIIDGQRYTIAIIGLRFTPERATLNAMIALDFPELHGFLGLGATDICFHPDGLAGLGRAMLYLPLDQELNWGDNISLKFKKTEFANNYTMISDSGTYVRWDCNGFNTLQVKGELLFGRNLLLPDLQDGTTGPGKVKATFSTTIRKKGDWFAELNFDRFQIVGLDGWGFQVDHATLDFSELTNSTAMVFPQGYTGDDSYGWKGFYLKNISLYLPPQFKTFLNPNQRLSTGIENMLIDKTGLSASFQIRNVLNLSDGNLNGWGFSIDTIRVDVLSNSLVRGGFGGDIKIPISDSALHYTSFLMMDTATKKLAYQFRIEAKDTINASLWVAKLALLPTSSITITASTSQFTAEACLTGSISIKGNIGNIPISLLGMEFEEFRLMTSSPYISCEHFAFASKQRDVAGFPVSITGIQLTVRDGPSFGESDPEPGPRAGLQFTLNLNLTGESNTFSAGTTLAILGRLNTGGGSGSSMWQFSGIALDSVGIGGSVGVVVLAGGVRFYRSDPVFGTGFRGFIRATFKPTVSIGVTAQFGEVNGYRYWYVDAMAIIAAGIPISSGVSLYGFGGGAWYHMNQQSPILQSALSNTPSSGATSTGGSSSGVRYVPDQNILFGFKATVIIGTAGGGDAVNADVTFSAQFNVSGGVDLMALDGQLYFMC